MKTIQARVLSNALRLSRSVFGGGSFPKSVTRDFLNGAGKILPPPQNLNIKRHLVNDVPALWLSDKRGRRKNVIYYLHGGGYHIGSPDSHKRLIFNFCRKAQAEGFALDYRKAPEHPYPTALNDALAGYKWLLKRGHKPENICISGDSAGGGLALATLIKIRDEGLAMPASLALLSPWLDLTASGSTVDTNKDIDPWLSIKLLREWGSSYLNGHDPMSTYASPLFADLSGLPPMIIHVGTNEVLLDDSRRLYENAKKCGVKVEIKIWDEMMHVFQAFDRILPSANKSLKEMGVFLQKHYPQV